jgi:hypothetical protein
MPERKIRTDMTGRHDVKPEEIIKGLTPPEDDKKDKVRKVIREFKQGKLRSGSGEKVTKRSQAVAIALSEAGLSKK